MAICLKCGAIMHDEDAPRHKCEAQDLPAKGQERKQAGLFKEVVAEL